MRITQRIPFAFRLINRIESFRPIEELTKRVGGIETKRRMITFAPQPLTTWFRRRQSAPTDVEDNRESVVIWPDTFTNFSEDAPGKAAVDVLEAMGYRY